MTATINISGQRAAVFGLLADPLRLRIVELLAAEEMCTCHPPHVLDALAASLTELADSAERAGRNRLPCAP